MSLAFTAFAEFTTGGCSGKLVPYQCLSMDIMMLQQALPNRRGLFFFLFRGLGRIVEYSFESGFSGSGGKQDDFIPGPMSSTSTFTNSEKAFDTMWEAADPTLKVAMDFLVLFLLLTILYLLTKLYVMLRQICHTVTSQTGEVV